MLDRKFPTGAELRAYTLGKEAGAEAAISVAAELVEAAERAGITDIAKLVRGLSPRLERAS